MTPRVREWLWQPLYLLLDIVVALFVVGAVYDWLGHAAAERLLVPAVIVGVAFWALTKVLGGNFIVFVAYEGVAMLAALVIYLALAWSGRVPGTGIIALAIALNLAAAGLQASRLQVTLVWPFDHNGLLHVVGIVAVVTLYWGLRASLS